MSFAPDMMMGRVGRTTGEPGGAGLHGFAGALLFRIRGAMNTEVRKNGGSEKGNPGIHRITENVGSIF